MQVYKKKKCFSSLLFLQLKICVEWCMCRGCFLHSLLKVFLCTHWKVWFLRWGPYCVICEPSKNKNILCSEVRVRLGNSRHLAVILATSLDGNFRLTGPGPCLNVWGESQNCSCFKKFGHVGPNLKKKMLFFPLQLYVYSCPLLHANNVFNGSANGVMMWCHRLILPEHLF